ncbi:hypothetical protein KKR91_02075 [Arthrobacter jiangjiafuii]|uniref:TfoX N-terminal domain-containing protein n=1 Tax=Arthrobacter jiangjiafuii TaxID=2817475 RepID=A0A975M5P8_9MICC|nr:hypothetical protein [Arthrobacter jiangjiafuii]MBP3044705.1 hypothetical protein [Arthrobacter jiangjiafuii]QWC10463.1 hypothetical protein KKR91_02075 [Arthrobacter jiangjiafuii]
MAPSQAALDLLHGIAVTLQAKAPITVGTMFRSPGLRTGTRIVAFLGFDDALIVKLPRARAVALVQDGTAEPVTMGTRTMREWVSLPVGADPAATRETWTGLAREALAYVRSIP